eukprot:111758-Chlamydomonas_euryale.AAC.7
MVWGAEKRPCNIRCLPATLVACQHCAVLARCVWQWSDMHCYKQPCTVDCSANTRIPSHSDRV